MDDVAKTIISQYANSPTLLRLINDANGYIDPRADFDAFIRLIWDLRSAQGVGLDMWGRIVGVGRTLTINDPPTYFGFDVGSGGSGGSPGGDPGGGDPGTPVLFPVAGSIVDRLGRAMVLRDGSYLVARTPSALPAGAIVSRNGSAITDRFGNVLVVRSVPDVVVPVVPVTPDPPVVDPVYPTGPYLKLTSAHSNVIIESQNGVDAVIRLVRPLYLNDGILHVTHENTSLGNINTFYTYKGPGDLFGIINGDPAVTRDILSTDDGTFTSQILQGMSDGSFLQVNITVKIAPTRTGAVPAPSAVPSKDSVIFYEPFDPGTGTGALTRTFGNITNTGDGAVLLLGAASAMTQTDPANRISNDYGFPNGRYEFDCQYIGDLGNRAGPAIVLWPASDGWPGPEVDLGEFFPDGSMYMALHWKDGTKPTANNGQNQNSIWPIPKPFDPHARHIYGADLLTDKVIFYIDGVEFARDTINPAPKDFAHGGENHTLGLLSGSDQSSDGSPSGMKCFGIKFTPEALIPHP